MPAAKGPGAAGRVSEGFSLKQLLFLTPRIRGCRGGGRDGNAVPAAVGCRAAAPRADGLLWRDMRRGCGLARLPGPRFPKGFL